MSTPPNVVVETSKKRFDKPPVVMKSGKFAGSTVKITGWLLYVAPAVPSQVPVSGKVNCVVSGAARSPCSSVRRPRFIGTHSVDEPMTTSTFRVSWLMPSNDAPVIAISSLPSVQVTGGIE